MPMTPVENAISLKNIRKAYLDSERGEQPIFEDFSLDIQQNQFVSVLGPSGCGKSTLLRLISGLVSYDKGDIYVSGDRVVNAQSNMSFVFQKPTLLPWLNVEQNILFPIKHRAGSVKESEHRQAQELLTLTGLQAHAKKRPNQLSGGMQQRVAIARALIQNGDVLLMDEPFSALDAMNREKLGFELLNLLKAQPKTVVFVTHSIPEAVLLSHKIIVLSTQPARVIDTLDIELPNDRNIETLSHPLFGQYCNQIRRHFYVDSTRVTCA